MICCNIPMEQIKDDEYVCIKCFNIKRELPKTDFHLECCGEDTVLIENLRTCLICGCAVEELVLQIQKTNERILVKKCIYKRTKYLKQKLDYYNGTIFINNTDLDQIIEKIKDFKFNTIFELSKLLKKNKLSRYHKHIYKIYAKVKGNKLIDLKHNQIQLIKTKFIEFERTFKKKNNKRNLWSYPVVLYQIFKNNGIDGYEHILLPHNHKSIIKNYNSII